MTRPGTPDETRRLLDECSTTRVERARPAGCSRTRSLAPRRPASRVAARGTGSARRASAAARRHSSPLCCSSPARLSSRAVPDPGSWRRPRPPPPPPRSRRPALVSCANGGPLGGDPATLWVGCPTGIRAVDTATEPLAEGDLIEGLSVPVTGGAGTWAIGQGGLVEVDARDGTRSPARRPGHRGARRRRCDRCGVERRSTRGARRSRDGCRDRHDRRRRAAARPRRGRIDDLGHGGRRARAPLRRRDAGARWPTAVVGSDAFRIAATSSAIYVVSQGVEGTVTRSTGRRTSEHLRSSRWAWTGGRSAS